MNSYHVYMEGGPYGRLFNLKAMFKNVLKTANNFHKLFHNKACI